MALLRSRSLSALQVGDETATALGVNVNCFRSQLLVAAALLTGAVVAVPVAVGLAVLRLAGQNSPQHRRLNR